MTAIRQAAKTRLRAAAILDRKVRESLIPALHAVGFLPHPCYTDESGWNEKIKGYYYYYILEVKLGQYVVLDLFIDAKDCRVNLDFNFYKLNDDNIACLSQAVSKYEIPSANFVSYLRTSRRFDTVRAWAFWDAGYKMRLKKVSDTDFNCEAKRVVERIVHDIPKIVLYVNDDRRHYTTITKGGN